MEETGQIARTTRQGLPWPIREVEFTLDTLIWDLGLPWCSEMI
jgi:hypothetical protein